MPTWDEIAAAAKAMCFANGIAECADAGCTPENCPHGMRDFGDQARVALEAAESVRVADERKQMAGFTPEDIADLKKLAADLKSAAS